MLSDVLLHWTIVVQWREVCALEAVVNHAPSAGRQAWSLCLHQSLVAVRSLAAALLLLLEAIAAQSLVGCLGRACCVVVTLGALET